MARDDKDAHWRNLYGGLKGIDARVDKATVVGFSKLDKISRDPEEDRARAINQSFVREKLGRNAGPVDSNWDAVKSAFAKSELYIDSDKISDKQLYGWIGARLNQKSEAGPSAEETGEIKPWTFQDSFSSDLREIGRSAGKFFESTFTNKAIDAIPEPPADLPDWSKELALVNPLLVVNSPAVAAGIWRLAKPIVSNILSPGGWATLGVTAELKATSEAATAAAPYAKAALAGISGLFAGLMGKATLESLPEIKRVANDPESTLQDKIAAYGTPVVNGLLSIAAGFGAVMEALPDRAPQIESAVKGKTPAEAAEALKQEAVTAHPDGADALNKLASRLEEIGRHEEGAGPERIAAAAIKQPDGTISEGASHEEIQSDLGTTESSGQEGFVTSTGRFVSREEAAPIAENAGQLTGETPETLRSHEVDMNPPRSTVGQTSLKNAYGELERVAYGFPEAPATEQRAMAERWARSGEVVAKDPEAGARLADALKANPNLGLSDDQSALLLRYKVGLQNALNEAADISSDVNQSPELRLEAKRQMDELSGKLVELLDAVTRRGSEWGREGRWRQALAREDYSFASQETLLRAAKGGAELSEPERAALQERIDALTKAQTKLEAKVAELQAIPREQAADRAVANMAKPPRAPRQFKRAEKVREKLHSKAEESRKYLSGKLFAVGPDTLYHMSVIGADYLYSTGLDFAKWSTSMISELGEKAKPLLAEVWEASKKLFYAEQRAGLIQDLRGSVTVEQWRGEDLLSLLKPTGRTKEGVVQELQRGLAERISENAPVEQRGAVEIELQGIRARISKTGEDHPEKLRTMWESELRNASPELRGAAERELAMQGVSSRSSSNPTTGKLGSVAQELARAVVESGIKDRDAVVDAVWSDLKKAVPDLTRREAMDAVSGYGRFKPLSRDRVSVELRDIKGQLQQVAKLEDMAAGEAPKKTGVERKVPSDEERRLIQQVEAKKKEGGYEVTDPEKELKTALQAVKTRLANQIKDLEKQIETREKIVKERRTVAYDAEADALKARRDELKEQFDQIFGRELSDQQRLNIWKANATRRAMELERRIAENDFEPTERRAPPPMDKEAISLRSKVERLKQDFAVARIKAEEAVRPRWQRALKTTADLARASALSGYHTLAKLATFSLARFGETPVVETLGALIRKIPGVEAISKLATNESGAEYEGIAKFFSEAATTGIGDAWETLRTGKSSLKAELDDFKKNIFPVKWYDYFGLSHMSEKSPLLRGDFELRLERGMRSAIANGLDVTDPLVQGAIRKDAFAYAQRAILQENNQFVDWLNSGMAKLEADNPNLGRSEVTKFVLSTFIKTFMTKGIVRVPSNYIWQTFERTPAGAILGTARAVAVHVRGIDKLTPKEADVILRLLKVGAVGTATFVWGMIDATKKPQDRMFGGYYQSGEKRGDEDVGWGKIRFAGIEFPHLFTHNPLTESAQMGSTFMRVMRSKLKKNDEDTRGVAAGAVAAIMGIASEAPIANPLMSSAQQIERGEAQKILWDEAAGLIPQLIQNIASDLDSGKSRQPKDFTERIEMTIPGLREKVEETDRQKRKDVQQKLLDRIDKNKRVSIPIEGKDGRTKVASVAAGKAVPVLLARLESLKQLRERLPA